MHKCIVPAVLALILLDTSRADPSLRRKRNLVAVEDVSGFHSDRVDHETQWGRRTLKKGSASKGSKSKQGSKSAMSGKKSGKSKSNKSAKGPPSKKVAKGPPKAQILQKGRGEIDAFDEDVLQLLQEIGTFEMLSLSMSL